MIRQKGLLIKVLQLQLSLQMFLMKAELFIVTNQAQVVKPPLPPGILVLFA